ncbi:P-loop containing nucleoside triphosphate hydrolase protein [Vararia minispora EC-137]|uniref:P-loop containing nucleoside triphosphate hydrolase protein n=1 Tax=Vararia minispora EC-137 TaxID=1314806 RepID=A0ACB8QB12_9AGAM|nr:P-loop containing nucleoside triphosphate hydrolase protein [Vararia minispora EC-137]
MVPRGNVRLYPSHFHGWLLRGSVAVEFRPDRPLQILAGPGSGKTKVLTARIAHLILVHSIPPWAICAVTFTNKAANEMKDRLTKLIGKRGTNQLKMGTIHALCAKLLRHHATLVDLTDNFTILDADEGEKLVGRLLKPHADEMRDNDCTLTRKDIHNKISRSKSKGFSPDTHVLDLLQHHHHHHVPDTKRAEATLAYAHRLVVRIWRAYDAELRASNLLDFDDLLVFGVRLVKNYKQAVGWCRHVLVDEFQDTNSLQYQLMRYIAADHDHITIVGDPDQSIYGWRSADTTNLQHMKDDFPRTQRIFLEQNYRSTASILSVSHAIIAQDKKRVQKTLHTQHPSGPRPMLCWFQSEHAESLFIAAEIKRLVACSGGMLRWQDFVVLLRFSALSRNVEAALQIEGIPHRVLKGARFFERAEIKDVLAFLQIADNPRSLPAFIRTVNCPPRGIGDKSVAQIVQRAEREKMSAFETCAAIVDGRIPDNKPNVKKKLTPYVRIVRNLQRDAAAGTSAADLVRRVLKLTEYVEYLRRGEGFEARLENVREFVSFAMQEQDGLAERGRTEDAVVVGQGEAATTPLREFLQNAMLTTNPEDSTEDDNDKVTISTCHAAKGLEWPVVFIPGVETDIFPFKRVEDANEERRLLYVAATRAQGLLYMLHCGQRMSGGSQEARELSRFIKLPLKDDRRLMSPELPALNADSRAVLAAVLGRPEPDAAECETRMAELCVFAKRVRAGCLWLTLSSPQRSVELEDASLRLDRAELSVARADPETAAEESGWPRSVG